MYIGTCYLYVKILRSDFYIFGNRIVQVAGKPVYCVRRTLNPVGDQQIMKPFFRDGNRLYTHSRSLLIPSEESGQSAEKAL